LMGPLRDMLRSPSNSFGTMKSCHAFNSLWQRSIDP
jgi:hypothetical protein